MSDLTRILIGRSHLKGASVPAGPTGAVIEPKKPRIVIEPTATNAEFTGALAAEFSLAVAALFSTDQAEGALRQVAALAVTTIDACDFAGIFAPEVNSGKVAVPTDDVVSSLAALQRRAREGPCLNAIQEGGYFYSGELADDGRWPRFGPEASKAGIRSALVVRLCNGLAG